MLDADATHSGFFFANCVEVNEGWAGASDLERVTRFYTQNSWPRRITPGIWRFAHCARTLSDHMVMSVTRLLARTGLVLAVRPSSTKAAASLSAKRMSSARNLSTNYGMATTGIIRPFTRQATTRQGLRNPSDLVDCFRGLILAAYLPSM